MPDRVNILGVNFDNITLTDAIQYAYEMIDSGKKHRIVTPNSEIVYMAKSDSQLMAILNDSDMVVPDGVGVVYASKILKKPLVQKVAGIELGEGLIAKMAENGGKLFLLGAKPGVAQTAADKLCKKYTGLQITGVHDGYFKDDAEVIDKINASGADVLFVCLGAPKQEFWMYKNQQAIHSSLMLGLGGSLDVFAEVSQRAPDIWIKLGLEWFYRLCKEPQRIGRMMALPKFLFSAIFSKKGES